MIQAVYSFSYNYSGGRRMRAIQDRSAFYGNAGEAAFHGMHGWGAAAVLFMAAGGLRTLINLPNPAMFHVKQFRNIQNHV